MENIKNFPRYERYKDSGVDWIGEIPAHWGIEKLKYLAEINPNHKMRKELQGQKVIFLPMEKISEIGEKDYSEFKVYQEVINGYTGFQRYDVILAKITPCFENGKSAYLDDMPTEYGFGSTEFHVIRAKNAIEKYLFHLVTSGYFRKEAEAFMIGSAGQKRVTTEYLKNYKFFIPPLPEQTSIAQFLDHKTAQIDSAIAIKEEQIKLLNERKQIMLQEAITKGLDPTVPMKDSGVEWIGEIPEHWEVKVLKYVLKEPLKYGANETGVEYQPNLPRYIRITDFSSNEGLNNKSKLSLTWADAEGYLLSDNDILFARSGATVGKSYQFKSRLSEDEEHAFAGYLIKASPNESIIYSDYLYHYANSNLFQNWRALIYNKATIENIGADKYAQLPVILPSLIEQKAILEFLSEVSKPVLGSINNLQKQIKILKEYKTTLINEAVTGKIKVN